MSEEVKVVFWDCDEDKEILTHTSVEEALEHYFDDLHGHPPEEVTVYGFAPRKITDKTKEQMKNVVIEALHEFLSENFDGENGHETPLEAEEAAKQLVTAYVDNYTPWICDQVEKISINPEKAYKAWIEETREQE